MSGLPKPSGLLGLAAVTAGIWHEFGYGWALVAFGGLLILDALT